jgi:formiminoglutamase
LGYPDDEGINNNGGRIGASRAPDLIRKYLYKMTPHVLKEKEVHIYDGGNLQIENSLFERHEKAAIFLESLLDKNNIISLGGGHDYGYADGKAFLHKFASQKPLIINFDAHLDVRPLNKDKITSGTPFYRLLSDFKDFDFLEVGIQPQCNSSVHMDFALDKKAKVLMWDEVLYSGKNYVSKILEFFEPYLLKKRPTYLSIDIDGFSSAYAPGASQVFATGFTPECFFPVFKVLCQRLDVKILGIYEVSPPLDVDERTSKLAAQIAFERIYS